IRKRWGLAPLLLDPGLHLIDAERGQAYDARAMVIDHHELLLLEVLENHPDLGLLDAEVGAELVCVHELADAAIDGFVEPAQERAATLASLLNCRIAHGDSFLEYAPKCKLTGRRPAWTAHIAHARARCIVVRQQEAWRGRPRQAAWRAVTVAVDA